MCYIFKWRGRQEKNDYKMIKNIDPKILMITPYHKQQRGNTITVLRIRAGMERSGWQIELCSLEERPQEQLLKLEANWNTYGMIHGFHAGHMSNFFKEISPHFSKTPFLLTMTGTDLHSLRIGKNEKMIAAVLDRAAAITVFNAESKSFLNSACPAWSEKTVLIPQGVSLKNGSALTREALGFSEKDFLFILPSGLRAIKDIDMAIEAISILHKRGRRAKLILVGPVIEFDYADHLISRINLNPEIKYLGAVDHADMKALLSLTNAVINCSQSEGQPQAVLEAMSLGIPCILTAVPGNLNLIENYGEGIFVQNAEDLALAMEFYLREPERLKDMGFAASELVSKQFSVQAEISAYDHLYRQILNG